MYRIDTFLNIDLNVFTLHSYSRRHMFWDIVPNWCTKWL